MTELTASVSKPVAGADRLSIEVADAVQLFAGGLAGLRGPGHATTQGFADALNDEAGMIPLGGLWSDEVLGDTAGLPVVNPENNVDVQDKILRRHTVAGVASRGDIGSLVYASDDNVLTLTKPATFGLPLGIVVEWHSGTTADVFLFGFASMAILSLGGGGVETVLLGTLNWVDMANGNVLEGYRLSGRGKILEIYTINGAILTGASGAASLNLEIDGVNVTGGVVALSTASTAAMGAKTAGSAITAANDFHDGQLLDVEVASAATTRTLGHVNVYAVIQRELGY